MRTLTIRKAYKTSCELKERISGAATSIGLTVKYDIFDAKGTLPEMVTELHAAQKDALKRNYHALKLVCAIRQRIQDANNKPLPYAEGATINDLIAKQATLKTMVAFFPEDDKLTVTDVASIDLTAKRNREQAEDKTNAYRSSTTTNLNVTGTSQAIRDDISSERLNLRTALEDVTSKLAYANITETIELSDEEAEILSNFRIPV